MQVLKGEEALAWKESAQNAVPRDVTTMENDSHILSPRIVRVANARLPEGPGEVGGPTLSRHGTFIEFPFKTLRGAVGGVRGGRVIIFIV